MNTPLEAAEMLREWHQSKARGESTDDMRIHHLHRPAERVRQIAEGGYKEPLSIGEHIEDTARRFGVDPSQPGRHEVPGCRTFDYPLDPALFEIIYYPANPNGSAEVPSPDSASPHGDNRP